MSSWCELRVDEFFFVEISVHNNDAVQAAIDISGYEKMIPMDAAQLFPLNFLRDIQVYYSGGTCLTAFSNAKFLANSAVF